MSYSLAFVESALKEWRKLDPSLRRQFKKKLAERLEHPHVPQAQLRTLPDSYKIKLRRAGYRLVYRVDDEEIVVTVVAVGKRDKSASSCNKTHEASTLERRAIGGQQAAG